MSHDVDDNNNEAHPQLPVTEGSLDPGEEGDDEREEETSLNMSQVSFL